MATSYFKILMIVKDKHRCFTKFDREPGECLHFKEVPNFKVKKKWLPARNELFSC